MFFSFFFFTFYGKCTESPNIDDFGPYAYEFNSFEGTENDLKFSNFQKNDFFLSTKKDSKSTITEIRGTGMGMIQLGQEKETQIPVTAQRISLFFPEKEGYSVRLGSTVYDPSAFVLTDSMNEITIIKENDSLSEVFVTFVELNSHSTLSKCSNLTVLYGNEGYYDILDMSLCYWITSSDLYDIRASISLFSATEINVIEFQTNGDPIITPIIYEEGIDYRVLEYTGKNNIILQFSSVPREFSAKVDPNDQSTNKITLMPIHIKNTGILSQYKAPNRVLPLFGDYEITISAGENYVLIAQGRSSIVFLTPKLLTVEVDEPLLSKKVLDPSEQYCAVFLQHSSTFTLSSIDIVTFRVICAFTDSSSNCLELSIYVNYDITITKDNFGVLHRQCVIIASTSQSSINFQAKLEGSPDFYVITDTDNEYISGNVNKEFSSYFFFGSFNATKLTESSDFTIKSKTQEMNTPSLKIERFSTFLNPRWFIEYTPYYPDDNDPEYGLEPVIIGVIVLNGLVIFGIIVFIIFSCIATQLCCEGKFPSLYHCWDLACQRKRCCLCCCCYDPEKDFCCCDYCCTTCGNACDGVATNECYEACCLCTCCYNCCECCIRQKTNANNTNKHDKNKEKIVKDDAEKANKQSKSNKAINPLTSSLSSSSFDDSDDNIIAHGSVNPYNQNEFYQADVNNNYQDNDIASPYFNDCDNGGFYCDCGD